MVFFTRIDPAKNISRFWLARVTPTLLGGWALLREWGRLGSPGTVSSRTYQLEEEARRAEREGIRRRELHGYQPTPDVVARWAEVMAAGGSIHAPPQRQKNQVKIAELFTHVVAGPFGLSGYLKKFYIMELMRHF